MTKDLKHKIKSFNLASISFEKGTVTLQKLQESSSEIHMRSQLGENMYTNSAVNPILNAFMSKNFRSSLKDLLRLKLQRRSLAGMGIGARARVSF